MNLAQAFHAAVRRYCDEELRPEAALRAELDRIDVETLEDVERVRELVVKIASSPGTGTGNRESTGAALLSYVGDLTDHELYQFNPLPYRRGLTRSESTKLWRRLRRFQATVEGSETFREKPFEEGASSLAYDFLAERGITRVWELREGGPEYEIELALFEPYYNDRQGFWTSDDFDWLVCARHPGSITVGGWLLGEVQAVWPEWDRHLWSAS